MIVIMTKNNHKRIQASAPGPVRIDIVSEYFRMCNDKWANINYETNEVQNYLKVIEQDYFIDKNFIDAITKRVSFYEGFFFVGVTFCIQAIVTALGGDNSSWLAAGGCVAFGLSIAFYVLNRENFIDLKSVLSSIMVQIKSLRHQIDRVEDSKITNN